MRRFLLDVNVLIALIDPAHVRHNDAHTWFHSRGRLAWATCPLSENGAVRIVGHRRYPNSPGTPSAVAESLVSLRQSTGHEFWADDVSLLDPDHVRMDRLSEAGQVTDTYLLALASAHHGCLATFDRRLVTSAIVNGPEFLYVLE